MRGVYHEHRVKLKPDRPRLDIAHPREQQCREHLPIRGATLDPCGYFVEHAFLWRILEQFNQRFDLRMQPDCFRIELRLLRRNRPELAEECEIAKGDERTRAGG